MELEISANVKSHFIRMICRNFRAFHCKYDTSIEKYASQNNKIFAYNTIKDEYTING